MKIKWIGHACFLIEGSKKIIIDPFITDNPKANYTDDDLKDIDYIAVTHDHGDHLGDTVRIAKENGAKVIAIYELFLKLQEKGVDGVGMNIGGTAKLEGAKFSMVQAMHSSDVGNPVGFIIEIDGKTIYHTGDTGLFYTMKLIGEIFKPDLLLVPIDGLFNMDYKQATKAVELIMPKKVIPMHYNTWPPIEANPLEFKKEAEKFSNVVILNPGETIEL